MAAGTAASKVNEIITKCSKEEIDGLIKKSGLAAVKKGSSPKTDDEIRKEALEFL